MVEERRNCAGTAREQLLSSRGVTTEKAERGGTGSTATEQWWHRPHSCGAVPEMPELWDTERLRVLCPAGAGPAHLSGACQADPEWEAASGIAAGLWKVQIECIYWGLGDLILVIVATFVLS